jgi:hypothetical protein
MGFIFHVRFVKPIYKAAAKIPKFFWREARVLEEVTPVCSGIGNNTTVSARRFVQLGLLLPCGIGHHYLLPKAFMLGAHPSCRMAGLAAEAIPQRTLLGLAITVLAPVKTAVTFPAFHFYSRFASRSISLLLTQSITAAIRHRLSLRNLANQQFSRPGHLRSRS